MGIRLTVPGQVKTGKTLHFMLVITYLTGQDSDLNSVWPYCPGDTETIPVAGKVVAKAGWEFNCAPAGNLAAAA